MNRWLACICALGAFLMALAVLPSTSWVVREFLDELAGGWRTSGQAAGVSSIRFVTPETLGPATDDPGKDDDTVFLKLLTPTPQESVVGTGSKAVLERRTQLYSLCMKQHTPEYLVQFIRQATRTAFVTSKPRPKQAEDLALNQLRRLIVTATVEGERLQPTNGYFPLMRAGQLLELGDRTGAIQALVQASDSSTFSDYPTLESNVRYQWLVAHQGYRGEQMRIWCSSMVALADVSSMRTTCVRLLDTNDRRMRIATAKVGALMMRQSSVLIGVLVGRADIAMAAVPEVKRGHEVKVEDVRRGLESFAPELSANAAASIANAYQALSPPLIFGDMDNESLFESMRPVQGGAVLTAIVAAGLIIAWVWLRVRFPALGSAAPYLVWLALIETAAVQSESRMEGLFMLGAVLALPAFFDRTRRAADLVGLVWAVGAFVFGVGTIFLPLIAGAFLICLIVERFVKRESVWLTLGTCLVVAGAVGWFLAAGIADAGLGRGLNYGIVLLVALLSFVYVRGKVDLLRLGGVAAVAAVVGLAVVVELELSANRSLHVVAQRWNHEADQVRSRLH